MTGNVSKSKHIVGHGLEIKGLVSSIDYLPDGANVGDIFQVGTDEQKLYLWDGESWEYIGNYRGMQGPKGDKGDKGDKGAQGDKGDPFEYDDFTDEQLEGLKGPKGDKGDKGDKGNQGIQGIQGVQGKDGYTPVKGKDYFTAEDIASLGIDNKVDKEKNKTLLEYVPIEEDYYVQWQRLNEDIEAPYGVSAVFASAQTDGILEELSDVALVLRSYTDDENITVITADGRMFHTKYNMYEDDGWTKWEKVSVSQTELDKKVNKVSGMGLSSNDFTDDEKDKLSKTNIYTKEEKDKLDTIINFIVLEDEHYLDNDIILDCLKRGNYSRGLNVVRTSIEDGLLLVSLTDYYEAVYIDYYGRTTHFESVTADDEDWVEDIGEQYATHSYVDSSISNAIGDIETSLENIIQKYGLGGDGV